MTKTTTAATEIAAEPSSTVTAPTASSAATTAAAAVEATSNTTNDRSEESGTLVTLNVYDLQHPDNPEAVPRLNWYLSFLGCGIYHSACVVHGLEYAFGGHAYPSTGIFTVLPKNAPGAKFKETVEIGRTHLTESQVIELIDDMSQLWAGNSYNLLSRNCNHFASDLCERLTGKAAPEWINRLAWVAERAKFLLPVGFDQPTVSPVVAPSITNNNGHAPEHESVSPSLSSSLLNSDYDIDSDTNSDPEEQ